MCRLMAVSGLIFLAACTPADRAIQRAAETRAAVEQARQLPSYPARCRQKHRSGVSASDRLDVALLKADAALVQHHRQTDACAAWYDDLRAGVADAP